MTLPNILRGYLDTRGSRQTGAQQAELQTIPMVLSLLRQQTQDQRQATMDAEQAALSPLRKRIMEAQAKAAEAGPLPRPKEKIVGDDGTVVFYDPTNPELPPDFKARGPAEPAGSFSFPTGADASGNPIVLRGNNRTGEITPTTIGRPQGGVGSGGVEKQKRIQALANVSDALNAFETTLKSGGTTVMPGVTQSALQTDYENLTLQLKELYNLGVLNGPDLELMRRVIEDPTSLKSRARSFGDKDEQQTRILAQVAKVREKIAGYQKNLLAGNNAITPNSPTAPPSGGKTIVVNGKTFVVPE